MVPLAAADVAGCFPEAGDDPWRPSADQVVSSVSASPIGLTDMSTGVTLTGSTIMGFDEEQVVTWSFTDSFVRSGSFGRLGGGPGEFAPKGTRRIFPIRGAVGWIDGQRDTVAVFDGAAIHLFATGGQFLGRLRHAEDAITGVLGFSGRLRRAGSGVLMDIEVRRSHDLPPGQSPRPYRLWSILPDRAEVMAEITLPPLPQSRQTGAYHGPEEASPFWDLARDCFVISDGGNPRLYVGRVGRVGVDTVEFPLPSLPETARSLDEPALMAQVGIRGATPPPSVLRAFTAMTIDPAGWVWLLPVQPREGANPRLRVFRISVRTGLIREDTVAVWPMLFAEPGIYFGGRSDSASGERRLVRVANRWP